MTWFTNASIWITLPLFVGGFVLASCLIVLALRPLVRRLVKDRGEWDRTLGHVIGTFGMFFGILLALVAVSVYENYAATRDATVEEVGQIGAFYRATTALPDEVGEPMRELIDDYLVAVIEEDFPLQREGVLPDASLDEVDAIEEVMHSFEAETMSEQMEYKQVLEAFDLFVEERRERLDATALSLPTLIWVVIWVGAAVNAVLIGLIYVDGKRMHVLMAGLLALFIGLVIFVTADMDFPYAGTVAVDAGAYERVYVQIVE
ncbi:hypothetical protein BCL57_000174 [Agromyces flavus]|uniref:DUF4239 domain-containing protein n=1 Tax=Agromyces flavus TaxID=589382 RepID=A0A1H1VZ66_9MICO|nr:DUF4239 domain-containing protein [Agromyces flavus]MCP2366032.1 hypothetical protein [Agromyces flavus]GGI43863.1 hypothetical protein GCM10010932_01720 [Agromyces flavus]SDS89369.1 Protein of unknown function [Agromyces flavus]